MTESDENVCCRSREFIETLYIMEPVDCYLPRRQLTGVNVHE
jgi:hypothetical protein